jgi:hypothetical protein
MTIPVYDYGTEDDNDFIREMPNSVYETELKTERWLGYLIGFGVGGLAGGIAWGLFYMV